VSDQTSTILIKLLSTGDLSALTAGQKQAETLTASLQGLRTALGSLGVGLSFGAILEGIKSTVEYGASIEHLAEQANISTRALQMLDYAAASAGLKQDDMAQALGLLNRNMAAAADGATKQNKAIEELGLNTATLLAMPEEQRLVAIAQAYVNAADKGKAWADVIALLGRNSARFQEIITQLGTTGLGGVQSGLIVSDADLQRFEKTESAWAILGLTIKAIATILVASKPSEGLTNLAVAMGVSEGAKAPRKAAGAAAGTPSQSVDDIRKQMQATLDATPQMIAANLALSKALSDEAHQYDTLSQKAAALMAEADEDEAKAKQIQVSGTMREDLQLEAKRLLTEAAKLRTQAEKDLAAAVKQAETEEARGDAERTRRAEQGIEMLAKWNQADVAQAKIAIAATEHDWNKTDNEKWQEKSDILTALIPKLEQYIKDQQANADNATLSPAARGKAQNAVESGKTGLASAKEALADMGPDPHSFIQNLSKDLTDLGIKSRTVQQSIASGLSGAVSSGFSSISTNLTGAITKTETWGQAIRSIGNTIETSLVQALVEVGLQMVKNALLKDVLDAADSSKTKTKTTEKAIEGGMESIAQLGPIYGTLAFAASLAAIMALAGGFEEGGYTGAAGGVVHPHEYVFSAPAVRAIGAGNLERAHQAAVASGPAGGGRSKPQRMIHVMAPNMISAKQMARDPSFDNVMLDWSRRRRGEQIET
jgi:hypothetical protein